MPATPADIAAYTNDGVLVTSPQDPAVSAAIAADQIDAKSGVENEIEMFYDLAADAQAALDERFAYLRVIAPLHLGIEVEEAIALGDTISVTPVIPSFLIVDDSMNLNEVARCRAYSHDMATDRFSVEVIT